MLEIPNISQNTTMGSNNSQVGLQYNHEEHHHYGLSVTDVTSMALELFRQYYPLLKDEAMRELRVLLENELRQRNPAEIVPPKSRIVIPTLQGASIAEEHDVRRLYANLLASTMDKKTANYVHPAYPQIIDQMDAFDARLMKKIVEINNIIPVARITIGDGQKFYPNAMPHYFSACFDDVGDCWAVSLSLENLSRLQQITISNNNVKNYDYTTLTQHPFVHERLAFFKSRTQDENLGVYYLGYSILPTDFGRCFSKICIPV